eukprot:GHRR01033062.1.p3 GENE.GHRR01033062.1~~GHRR01033062.1.p3  ORF type:complete len:105 (-),score=22.55 GHRR01033062.1:1057-1371(-)
MAANNPAVSQQQICCGISHIDLLHPSHPTMLAQFVGTMWQQCCKHAILDSMYWCCMQTACQPTANVMTRLNKLLPAVRNCTVRKHTSNALSASPSPKQETSTNA